MHRSSTAGYTASDSLTAVIETTRLSRVLTTTVSDGGFGRNRTAIVRTLLSDAEGSNPAVRMRQISAIAEIQRPLQFTYATISAVIRTVIATLLH